MMTTSKARQNVPAPMDHALLARLTGGLGSKQSIERISSDFGSLYSSLYPDVFDSETGISVDVSYLGCTSGIMTNLIADLGDTFSLSDGSLRNWCPNFVLACSNSFVIAVMERMLGAEAAMIEQPFERPLSEIELDLAHMVIDKMADVLQSGINASGDFEATTARPHNAEDRPQPDDTVEREFGVAIRLHIEFGKVSSELALIIPQHAFLKTKVILPKATGQLLKSQEEWRERLREQVKRSQVTLQARISLQPLTLGTLSRLVPGDIISFQDTKDVSVHVSANGKDMYSCELGRSGERYTVRVKDNFNTDDEILNHLIG